jgi:hypothetical protein
MGCPHRADGIRKSAARVPPQQLQNVRWVVPLRCRQLVADVCSRLLQAFMISSSTCVRIAATVSVRCQYCAPTLVEREQELRRREDQLQHVET